MKFRLNRNIFAINLWLLALGLIAFGAGTIQAAGLSFAVSETELTAGEILAIVVSTQAQNEEVTGLDVHLELDSQVFERIGSGASCDSSEYRDLKTGDWFIEGCLAFDDAEGSTYLSVSKSILLNETGYGVLDGSHELMTFLVRVRESAPLGQTEVVLSNVNPRISKVFNQGVQEIVSPQTIAIAIVEAGDEATGVDASSSGGSSRSGRVSDTFENEVTIEVDTASSGTPEVIVRTRENPQPVAFSAPEEATESGVSLAANAQEVLADLENYTAPDRVVEAPDRQPATSNARLLEGDTDSENFASSENPWRPQLLLTIALIIGLLLVVAVVVLWFMKRNKR